MKISQIDTYLLEAGIAKKPLLCRVTTDEGLYGWGEGYVVQGKEKVVLDYIDSMESCLIGRDAFHIRHTAHALQDDFLIRRGSPDFYSAWSAVEMALWDIVGKAAGQPIYNLLGGPSRERIRVYANGWYNAGFGGDDTPQGMAERALRVRELGFTALKWDPFLHTPWRDSLSKSEEDAAVEAVKNVREAVGPHMDIMLDMHRRLTPYNAAHFVDRIAECNPYWLEEPSRSDNIQLLVEAKRRISFPVVAGETLYTKFEFRTLFEHAAAEIVNPDVCACGGISGMLDIAVMAEPYQVLVSPHVFDSMAVGLAATVQASAVMSNCLIVEYFLNLKAASDDILIKPLSLDGGFLDLPTDPGLGIDIDMDRLEKHLFNPAGKRPAIKKVAFYHEEFPRKEDFGPIRASLP